jgi:hypothetical protein
VKHTYQFISKLWEKILCLRELGKKWFSLDCVKGHCTHYNIKQLPICDKEFDSSNLSLVKWRAFEKVIAGKTKDGEIKEVVHLETKLISPRKFMLFAAPKI